MRYFAPSLNAADQSTFEVASVKRTDRCGGGGSIDPGLVTLKGVPIKALLMEAFTVRLELIQGPSWMETDCFDISAKIPQGVGRDQIPIMLQALLVERFKLVARKETRQHSGFALVVDKGGPKFKEDDPDKNFLGNRTGQTFYGGFGRGALKGVMTMAVLASNLSKQGYGSMEDATGLTGKYDIELHWGADPTVASKDPTGSLNLPEGASLFAAIRESLGLKLERRNVQEQILVVEQVERIPTGN